MVPLYVATWRDADGEDRPEDGLPRRLRLWAREIIEEWFYEKDHVAYPVGIDEPPVVQRARRERERAGTYAPPVRRSEEPHRSGGPPEGQAQESGGASPGSQRGGPGEGASGHAQRPGWQGHRARGGDPGPSTGHSAEKPWHRGGAPRPGWRQRRGALFCFFFPGSRGCGDTGIRG